MFEKLVVSTNGRRKHRTAWFFAGTSLTYVVIVAAVLAISVLAASPKLLEGGLSPTLKMIELPPRGQQNGPRSVIRTQPSAPRDLRRFVEFDALTRGPLAPSRRIPELPGVTTQLDPNGGDGPLGGVPWGADVPSNGVHGGEIEGTAYIPPPSPAPRRTEPDKGPMRIPSKILQGHAIERYSPDYPKIARQAGVHGEVSVEVIVSPTGSVESARAISGHPLLASCAVEAARRWRFQPTLLNGVAVRVTGVITFVFKLDE